MSAPLSQLIDHILETHHAYMKVQLPRVEARLAKVLHAHGDRHGDMLCTVARVYGAMKTELDGHLAKEEMVLFPLVRALEGGASAGSFHCGSVQNPIRVMFMEHDSAGDALAELRRLTGGYTAPIDACNTFPVRCTSSWKRWSATCIATSIWKTTFSSPGRSHSSN